MLVEEKIGLQQNLFECSHKYRENFCPSGGRIVRIYYMWISYCGFSPVKLSPKIVFDLPTVLMCSARWIVDKEISVQHIKLWRLSGESVASTDVVYLQWVHLNHLKHLKLLKHPGNPIISSVRSGWLSSLALKTNKKTDECNNKNPNFAQPQQEI